MYLAISTANLYFSDGSRVFEVAQPGSEVAACEGLPGSEDETGRIIGFQGWLGADIACTSHGEMYIRPGGGGEGNEGPWVGKWTKLYYNHIYANAVKSQSGAQKLRPEYTRVSMSSDLENLEVAFVGHGVLPIVYSLIKRSIVWQGRNVSNDELDLEVPIDDVECCFIKKNYHLVVAHAGNKIRVYDVRGRRRKPIVDAELR
jgi:hypothetical protein